MTDDRRGLSRRELLMLSAVGGLGAMGLTSALDADGHSGQLTAGSMALSQAFNVAQDFWIGPNSAKSNVTADSGRVYWASDTGGVFYGDGGAWVKFDADLALLTADELSTDARYASGREKIPTLTDGPGWTWFYNPVAIHHNDLTITGGVKSASGDLVVASYDHSTETVAENTLTSSFETDDHANIVFSARSDDHILAFYTKHNDTAIRYKVSSNPNDISSFGSEQTFSPSGSQYSYLQLWELSAENRLYMLYQSGDSSLGYTYSTDEGSTWASGDVMVDFEYFQTHAGANGRIDILCNTGGNVAQVQHMRFSDERLFASDGTQIGSPSSYPIATGDATVVYDSADHNGHGSWVWDVAYRPSSSVVEAVYQLWESEESIHIGYGRWDGSSWTHHNLGEAGTKITPSSHQEKYGPGIALDKQNEGVIFASVGDNLQSLIERLKTTDGGTSWRSEEYATGFKQNFRPVGVKNAHDDLPCLWLRGTYSDFNNLWDTAIVGGSGRVTIQPGGPPTDVIRLNPPDSAQSISGDGSEVAVDLRGPSIQFGGLSRSGDNVLNSRGGVFRAEATVTYPSVTAAGTFWGRIQNNATEIGRLTTVEAASGEEVVLHGTALVEEINDNLSVNVSVNQDSGSAQDLSTEDDEVFLDVHRIYP